MALGKTYSSPEVIPNPNYLQPQSPSPIIHNIFARDVNINLPIHPLDFPYEPTSPPPPNP